MEDGGAKRERGRPEECCLLIQEQQAFGRITQTICSRLFPAEAFLITGHFVLQNSPCSAPTLLFCMHNCGQGYISISLSSRKIKTSGTSHCLLV